MIVLYKNIDCITDLKLNIPAIYSNECFEIVKEKYNIKENLVFSYIAKFLGGEKQFPFSLYNPKNGERLEYEKICEEATFDIENDISLKLNKSKIDIDSLLYLSEQNIDVFNISSIFYTDICYHFDSPIDKDIALKDRVSLYYPNITLCENGCKTKGINLTTFRALCECKLNNLLGSNLFENNLLYQSYIGEIQDLISKTNIEVLRCYKDIFNSKYLISNVGVYIILFLFVSLIILTIIYFCKNAFSIQKYIFDITEKFLSHFLSKKTNVGIKNYKNSMELIKNEPVKKKKKISKDNDKGKNKKIRQKQKSKTKAPTRIDKKKKTNVIQQKKRKILQKNKSIKNHFIHDEMINDFSNNNNQKQNFGISTNSIEEIYKYNKFSNKFNFDKDKNELLKNKNDMILDEYLKTDLDDLDYDDAIKRDNRKFSKFFFEKVKANQMISNTFCTVDPLRPRSIKIILLILDIDLYLFVNGLFFNEEYVSEIFNSNEPENFFTFVPRSIERFFYTTLVSVIVGYVIDCFFIEEKKIKKLFIREKDNIIILKYEISQIIKNTQKRNKWFIILSFIIIIITFYYVFCFNSIYPHMRSEWIKSSILIIIAMQILSFLACLLEAIIRFISFRCKSEKIYKISLLFS